MAQKQLVQAIQDITTGAGDLVPQGTFGEHITTQRVPPFHMLVKWPRLGHCDTNPKQVRRV